MDNIMGNRIRSLRKECGFTQSELAAKLGVQTAAVNKWESGAVQNIKRSTIETMAQIFDVQPVWLMGLESDMKSYDGSKTSLPSPEEAFTKDQISHAQNDNEQMLLIYFRALDSTEQIKFLFQLINKVEEYGDIEHGIKKPDPTQQI